MYIICKTIATYRQTNENKSAAHFSDFIHFTQFVLINKNILQSCCPFFLHSIWSKYFRKSVYVIRQNSIDLLESFFMDSTTKMIPTRAAKASSVNLVKYLQ